MARAAVLSALVAAALAAPAAAAPSVLHVGDSLAVGSDPPLRALLPGWSFTTDALKSRPTGGGVAIVDREASLPRALVIELGTNDSPDATQAFAAAVEHVVELAGARRCVVWVNVHRPPFNGVSYAGFNSVLARAQAAAPNLAVVDWDAMVRSGRVAMADDVHPTPDGYEARAQAIARTLRGCTAAPGGRRVRSAGASHTIAGASPRRRRNPSPAPKPARIEVYTPTDRVTLAYRDGDSTTWRYLAGGALLAVLLGGGVWRLRSRRG